MTVDDLIETLRLLPPEQRKLELRIWIPASQICITDGAWPHRYDAGPNGGKLEKPVILIEGSIFPGSLLERR